MELISWNIQWGRGADGRVDLSRTVATLRNMANADVLCLQEITRGFVDLDGQPQRDQVAELMALLPGYRVIYAPGVDRTHVDGSPRQFGNVIATRLPIKTLDEFIAYAKANPGKMNFSSPGAGTMPHIGAEILRRRFGFEAAHVPYRGGAPSLGAVVSGDVEFTHFHLALALQAQDRPLESRRHLEKVAGGVTPFAQRARAMLRGVGAGGPGAA